MYSYLGIGDSDSFSVYRSIKMDSTLIIVLLLPIRKI